MEKEKLTKKQHALNLIEEELEKHGVIAREKAMKLYMRATNQTMNGSVNSVVTLALSILKKQGYVEIIERGLYKKI